MLIKKNKHMKQNVMIEIQGRNWKFFIELANSEKINGVCNSENDPKNHKQ